MVYIGLEFGSWFEVPWDSPCYQAVRGVNPVLQLIFTFSQMYFVFMNSRVSPLEEGKIFYQKISFFPSAQLLSIIP